MRGSGYYDGMIFASLGITIGIIFIATLVIAALTRTKLEKISPKIIYFYTMAFISLIFVADGIGTFISMIADLIVALGIFNIEIKKAFLTFFSILVVAIPSYLFHWTKMLKGLGLEEEEKILWPYYKYMVLGLTAIASLVFIGTLFYQALSSLLGISKFNWSNFNIVLGYGIVGIAAWVYHWGVKMQFDNKNT
ncbi:MAG: DUF5671 domain-containing protein [Candidatus Omnitrophota bacterium]